VVEKVLKTELVGMVVQVVVEVVVDQDLLLKEEEMEIHLLLVHHKEIMVVQERTQVSLVVAVVVEL
jgi:hypothetical protein